jgi:hypothetical protein
LPEIQKLESGVHDENSEIPLQTRIENAALKVIHEQFEANYEEAQCRLCKVKALCPLMPEGRQVAL